MESAKGRDGFVKRNAQLECVLGHPLRQVVFGCELWLYLLVAAVALLMELVVGGGDTGEFVFTLVIVLGAVAVTYEGGRAVSWLDQRTAVVKGRSGVGPHSTSQVSRSSRAVRGRSRGVHARVHCRLMCEWGWRYVRVSTAKTLLPILSCEL